MKNLKKNNGDILKENIINQFHHRIKNSHLQFKNRHVGFIFYKRIYICK